MDSLSTGRQTDPAVVDRLARIETRQHFERVLMDREVAILSLRLTTLERRPQSPPVQPIDLSGWVKVAVAVLLPLSVLVVTGSPRQAADVAVKLVAP